MSFFSDLKAERLIADIRGIGDPLHPECAEGVPEAREDRSRRNPQDPRRARRRRQEGNGLVRRDPDAAGRQQDLPDAGAGAGGRQPAHDRSGELGADREPQLQPQPADRTAGARRRLQAGGAGHHRGAEAAASRCATCCSTRTARRRTRRRPCSASSASWRTRRRSPS